ILPIDADDVAELIREGDTRWLNRGAHDLMNSFPDAVRSESGILRGRSLYGSLPEQLKDSNSFARRLAHIIELRNRYGIATAQQLDVPTVSHKGLLVLVHELAQGAIQATVINFSSDEVAATIQSKHLTPGAGVFDMFDDSDIGVVDELNSFPMTLGPYQGVPVILR
ncbi:MAG: maltose alpha-D-glucosyltransferase, partial [Rhodococcus sp. (in: high G+C Gram-positive bacteria)]